jgi:hypothetical protein
MTPTPLDVSQFQWIESQTSEEDREALLSLREAVCGVDGTYRYLEVGSHLGGSLQPHVIDDRCVRIFSIDPRPSEQPDERWSQNYRYEGNSTARMLDLLSKIPGANVGKIQTFEASSWELSPEDIRDTTEFAFIDGEHTNEAVFRDFTAVRRFLSPTAVLAFHDCFVIPKALLKISQLLRREGGAHHFCYFPKSNVVAIVFGSSNLVESLRTLGWKDRLPITRWHAVKVTLKRRLPAVVTLVTRYKQWRAADAKRQG